MAVINEMRRGLAPVALAVAVFRSRPPGHPARRGAIWSVVFILSEAAVGAGLVLFRLVADNDSTARAMAMAAHLINTNFLHNWRKQGINYLEPAIKLTFATA